MMSVTDLWWREPADDWIQAIPIGNGSLGGRVFGGVHRERIALNVDTLWAGRPRRHGVTDGPRILADIRKHLLGGGDRAEADSMVTGLQGLIEHTDVSTPTEYRRDLDLSSAIVHSELSEPPIGSDGRLQEWSQEFSEPEPGHRHLSHL